MLRQRSAAHLVDGLQLQPWAQAAMLHKNGTEKGSPPAPHTWTRNDWSGAVNFLLVVAIKSWQLARRRSSTSCTRTHTHTHTRARKKKCRPREAVRLAADEDAIRTLLASRCERRTVGVP